MCEYSERYLKKRATNELNSTACLGESTITRRNISLVWRRRQNMAAMTMLNSETKRKCFCFSFFLSFFVDGIVFKVFRFM